MGCTMMPCLSLLLAIVLFACSSEGAPITSRLNVLVVYAVDADDTIHQLAEAVAEGAESVGATTRTVEVTAANYKRDSGVGGCGGGGLRSLQWESSAANAVISEQL